MYSNTDFKRVEEYLSYAFDKAHNVFPANAQGFNNYSEDGELILIEELHLNRFYLKKLIELCNPSFNFYANEEKIKTMSEDYKPLNTWDDSQIGEIFLTPNQLIQLIDFVQCKGSQTKLFL